MHDHDGVSEDPVRHAASGPERTGRRARRLAAALAGLAYGTWAVSLPPFSGAATAAVLAGGGVAVLWGAISRHDRFGEAPTRAAQWPWAALAAAVGGWQLAAYVQSPRVDHPTLSSLANALLDSHPARAVAFLAWLLVAARLSRR